MMDKIKQDYDRVPGWFKITRQMVPDVIAKDPKKCPVWEITGAEFSKAELHTAGGISIRFPRVTKVRKDKNWKTATSLKELQHLYNESKNNIDVDIPAVSDEEDNKNNNTPKKRKENPSKTSPVKKMKIESNEASPVNVKSEVFEYDDDDKLMMSGEDAIPPATKNLS